MYLYGIFVSILHHITFFRLTSNLSTSTSLLLLVIFLNGNFAWRKKSLFQKCEYLNIPLWCIIQHTWLMRVYRFFFTKYIMCMYVLIFICFYVKNLNVDGFYLLCGCCCCHDWKIDKASLQFLKSPKKTVISVFNCKYTKEPGMSPQLANFKAFRTKQI